MLAICLDTASASLSYASAGHPTGYVIDATGAVKAELQSTGMPLGVDADATFDAANAGKLAPGDTVLMLTDGIVEAAAPPVNGVSERGRLDLRDMFGTERAVDIVRANSTKSAREIVQALHAAVSEFTGAEPQIDDVTAVIVKAL